MDLHAKPLALAAFKDNYIWLLRQGNKALVVDPGDASVVLNYLQHSKLELECILITHHHHDHTGGVLALQDAYPQVKTYVPEQEQSCIQGRNEAVSAKSLITWRDYHFSVLELPGHTLGHVAYYSKPWLFCGDTVFNAGCGRIFEGSVEQMWQSLERVMALPTDTLLYPTHEYTLANLEFALVADPRNTQLQAYKLKCQQLRDQQQPTLPTSLATQLEVNPYFRARNLTLQQHWQQPNALETFRVIRAKKDSW